jgi:glyoxylase-like metal-dependent hydrolase (beta-lactamase superfamily II)
MAFMDQILKGLYRLGSPEFPAFLVVGSHRVVQVDAGPAFMGPVYLQDIPKVLGKERGPGFLFHTHSHFDHVGSTPFLQRHFPEIKVGGSETFARRLSQTKTGKSIGDLNRALVQKNNMDRAFIPGDFDYSLLIVEQILKDGDFVDLGGGVSLEVIATPGHTSDSLSFFLPHLEAVLAGDTLGIMPGDDFWVAPQFLSSYENYLDSIERIRKRAPKIILLGHHSVVRQAECEKFFNAAVADCRAFREMIEQYLKESHMKEEMVVQRIQAAEYQTLRGGKQPEAAFLLNLTAQVRLIATGMKRDRAG